MELTLSELKGPLELSLPRGTTATNLPEPRLVGEVEIVQGSDAASKAAILTRVAPYDWSLDPGGATSLSLRWEVALDHRLQPETRGDEYEYPYLADDHGMLSTCALYLAPYKLKYIEVTFELPKDWALHVPWPELGEGRYAPTSVRSLQDDLIAIGDWDVVRTQIEELDLTIAFAPGQDELRSAVPELIESLVAAELAVFGCTPQPKYTFLFGRPDTPAFGGSPKTWSMTLSVDAVFPLRVALDGLTHLISHEFHHTWGRARCRVPLDLRFLGEGFTDYYAWMIPWRAGIYDDGRAAGQVATGFAHYEQNQIECGLSLIECGSHFEQGAASTTLLQGGRALALLLDLRIRQEQAEKSLDDLMRVFYEDPRWGVGRNPQVDDLLERIVEFTDEEFAKLFETWLGQTEQVDLVQALKEFELELGRELLPLPSHPGALFEGTTLVAIDPSASAAFVGVLTGDRFVAINGTAVSTEDELRAAWHPTPDGRVEVLLERPGEEERVHLAAEWPQRIQYDVPIAVLDRLR